MGKKTVVSNILSTFLLQFVTIVNGLVVPKIFLSLFGSEANGMVTSISQFLNYVTLLEGGISGVVLASLYKPLQENDQKKISGIFNATQHFFRQIGAIYIVYSIILAFVYPLIVETPYSYGYVFALILVLTIKLFTQYFFSMSYQILIKASQKVYLISRTKAIVLLLNIVAIFVCSKIFEDLIFIKAISSIILFIQPVVFSLHVRKHFELDKTVPRDKTALSQRWSGFGHTLAYFINTNISIIMLTAFSTLSLVSVYSVYIMITNAIRNLIVALASALIPSVGAVMSKGNKEESSKAFGIYSFGMGFFTMLLFTCGIVLILPFVKIYTSNITDVNYIRPAFAIVLMVAELIYCFREPYINAAYAAGHFKQTVKFAYIESALNIIISLILVHKLNLLGVAIALLVSMTYRMVAHVIYLKNNILHLPIYNFVKLAVVFFSTALFVTVLSYLVLPLSEINSYWSWIVCAIFVGMIGMVSFGAVSLVFFKPMLQKIIGGLSMKKKL